MDLSRSNPSASRILKSQSGFAMALVLTLLPILLAAGFAFLFSNYLIKNWMQSLHICRTELLKTQSLAHSSLNRLMTLNNVARSLRVQLATARALLALAVASKNPALASKALAQILKIQNQQKALDLIQKNLISLTNFQMSSGLQRVVSRLHAQNSENLSRATSLFHFRIDSINVFPRTLAVHPDLPDMAPVYELNKNFIQSQSLSVSWISHFQTNSKEGFSSWIQNLHSKKSHCAVSLKEEGGTFQEILTEGRSLSRL